MTTSHHCFVADCATLEFEDGLPKAIGEEGYLSLSAKIARSGLQDYHASELGIQDSPKEVIRVYRPAEEVFDLSSMDSFKTKPVTLDHPPTMVDPSTFKDYAVGFSSHDVRRDGDHLRTELVIMDEGAIKAVENGRTELSIGYFADYEFASGVTSDGESYDAIQRNIRGNHIALVKAGRCGGTCRVETEEDAVEDAEFFTKTLEQEEPMTVITVDDQPFELNEEAASLVHRLLAQQSSLKEELDRLETVDVDQLVEERIKLIETAKRFLPTFDSRGLSNSEFRLTLIQSVFSDEEFTNQSDDYLAARLDALHIQAEQISTADDLGTALAGPHQWAKARDTYLNSLTSSWKGR